MQERDVFLVDELAEAGGPIYGCGPVLHLHQPRLTIGAESWTLPL